MYREYYHVYSIFFFKYICFTMLDMFCIVFFYDEEIKCIELNWIEKILKILFISLYNLLFVNNEIMMHTSVLKADLKVSSIAYHNNASSHKDNGQTKPR